MIEDMQIKDIGRFNTFFVKGEVTECWLWKGGKDTSGYGRFTIAGRDFPAHRVAFFIHHNTLADELDVMHSCDTRTCVNPSHLLQGTRLQNMEDARNKGRTCRGARHILAKLTDEQVLEIRAKYVTGLYTYIQLGVIYGVSDQTILSVVNRRSYTYLP